MFADEGADDIGPAVAELGDENEVEDVEGAADAGEKIYFLNEVQQPGHVHQTEERGRDGQDAGGVTAGEESADTQTEHKKNEEAGFEIVGAGGGAGNAQLAGAVQEG